MKKVLLSTVALIAFAAPAAAADLAARPYTKAPAGADRRRATTGAASTSAPMAAGVRATSAGTSTRRPACSSLPRAAMTRPAARPVVRSAIAGRPAAGCSALKPRATGPTSRAAMSACLTPAFTNHSTDRRIRPVHRPGRLRRQQRPVLREGRRCGDRGSLPHLSGDRHRRSGCHPPTTTPAGVPWSAPASNSASRRTGRPASNTTICSCRTAPTASSTPAGVAFGNDRIQQDVDLVTVRVNYRWGGPVIAKY